MKQYKIKVNNEAEAVEAQDLFEKLGYKKEIFEISDFPKCVITDNWHIDGKDWWYSCGAEYPRENVLHEELSLEELRALAAPRLYLDPHNGYQECYAVVPQEHWIEVPEGAEVCVESKYYPENYFFFKNNGTWFYRFISSQWVECDKEFIEDGRLVEYAGQGPDDLVRWSIVKHPEELPFVDDELQECVAQPSGGGSAWSTQVGGDHYKHYKIQPMEFALANNLDAAQANVIKYVMRHKDKKGLEDLQKAKHYIDLMIAHYYGGGV